MKGIILAGGKGTRLSPLTEVTNKHLIPVGNLPMIEYPLYTLKALNVNSIGVVTGGEHFKDIAKYLGNMHPEINFSYLYQKQAGGIAQALSLIEDTTKEREIAVVLGDNIFEENFNYVAKEFVESGLGAKLFLKRIKDPERFGVANIKGERIVSIEEKPKNPKSNLAVTGFYLFDKSVFEKIKKLKPSKRGELEITDVNNMYIQEGIAGFHIVKGFWSDAGTHNSRYQCSKFVQKDLEKRVIKRFESEIREQLPKDLY